MQFRRPAEPRTHPHSIQKLRALFGDSSKMNFEQRLCQGRHEFPFRKIKELKNENNNLKSEIPTLKDKSKEQEKNVRESRKSWKRTSYKW